LTQASPISQVRAACVTRGRRPDRGRSSIAFSGPHHPDPARAARDPLAVNAQQRGDLAGVAPIGQMQDDGRALDMMCEAVRERASERARSAWRGSLPSDAVPERRLCVACGVFQNSNQP